MRASCHLLPVNRSQKATQPEMIYIGIIGIFPHIFEIIVVYNLKLYSYKCTNTYFIRIWFFYLQGNTFRKNNNKLWVSTTRKCSIDDVQFSIDKVHHFFVRILMNCPSFQSNGPLDIGDFQWVILAPDMGYQRPIFCLSKK